MRSPGFARTKSASIGRRTDRGSGVPRKHSGPAGSGVRDLRLPQNDRLAQVAEWKTLQAQTLLSRSGRVSSTLTLSTRRRSSNSRPETSILVMRVQFPPVALAIQWPALRCAVRSEPSSHSVSNRRVPGFAELRIVGSNPTMSSIALLVWRNWQTHQIWDLTPKRPETSSPWLDEPWDPRRIESRAPKGAPRPDAALVVRPDRTRSLVTKTAIVAATAVDIRESSPIAPAPRRVRDLRALRLPARAPRERGPARTPRGQGSAGSSAAFFHESGKPNRRGDEPRC